MVTATTPTTTAPTASTATAAGPLHYFSEPLKSHVSGWQDFFYSIHCNFVVCKNIWPSRPYLCFASPPVAGLTLSMARDIVLSNAEESLPQQWTFQFLWKSYNNERFDWHFPWRCYYLSQPVVYRPHFRQNVCYTFSISEFAIQKISYQNAKKLTILYFSTLFSTRGQGNKLIKEK